MSVSAHDPFEITTVGRASPGALELEVSMSQATAALLLSTDGDATLLRKGQFESKKPLLEASAQNLFIVSSAGRLLLPTSSVISLGQEKDIDVILRYPAPATGLLIITASHIAKLPDGYGNAINLTQKTPPAVLGFKLLTKDDLALEAVIVDERIQILDTNPNITLTSSALDECRRFLFLGVQHILMGADHLLFLGGLLIATRKRQAMLVIITCFTLGHSITLGMAALDFVNLPSRVAEPLIAVTIIFVGVENIFTNGVPKWRWLLTAVFGLIHGFGFASVLRALDLGANGGSLIVPLFSFNLGVELGQIGVCAIVLPLIFWMYRRPQTGVLVCRYTSLGISLLGTYWLIERTVMNR